MTSPALLVNGANPMNDGANHALRVIQARDEADELVRRVQDREINVDALGLELAPLYATALRARCRAVAKAHGRAS